MNGSLPMFNHPTTVTSSTENVHGTSEQSSAISDGGKRRQSTQQPRQLLSCTKCRERKVKCDRTKPCSACCARGAPKECFFIAEGGDYAPIQQSYELRRLRAENLRLKERLRANKLPTEEEDADHIGSPDSPHDGPTTKLQRRRTARQKRFQSAESADSIYFGSPGLANVINEFASINVTPSAAQSLTHAMPRGADMYAPKDLPLYPFATIFPWSLEECIPELLRCLPPKDDLYGYLDTFQARVHVCFFPSIPTEITKSEVERFLSDARKNADRCPDMLALLFAALALGSQHCVWDKCGGKWIAGAVERESQRGNLYIAAAMQALRMASFMNRPTLLGIQALIMMGPYLTNSGRFLDAWTLFGTTIRLAQSIGLHRHPKYLDPAPPTEKECSTRQTIWWWMLHLDQQYSMTLGRPLGISGIGDCLPPDELTTNPTILRFGEFVHQFTLLARHILSSDRLSNSKIDEFTDSLRGLLDTMPESLQFTEEWLKESTQLPDWPLDAMAAVFYCKIHNYLILLNRQRIDKHPPPTYHRTPPVTSRTPPSFQPSTHPSPTTLTRSMLRGRALVLASSEDLLTAFLFFYHRVPAALICWTMGQQAFNSCMILILDAMETGDLGRMCKVEQAYVVFTELDKKGVHKLANLAVERVSWGLSELKKMQDNALGRQLAAQKDGRRRPGADVEMQGSGESEVTPSAGLMHDTVMGNTGMLLLEDSGLQSFVPEAFSPLTWVMAGSSLHGASLMQLKQEEEHALKRGVQAARGPERNMSISRHNDTRSPEEVLGHEGLQGLASNGSTLGSAPSRYAILQTAPSQEHAQPQGLSSPTSPISVATSTPPTQQQSSQQQSQRHYHIHGLPADTPQIPPPHLRYRSYPSLHQHHAPPPPPPLSSLNTSHTSSAITSTDTSPDRQFGNPDPYFGNNRTASSVTGADSLSSQPSNLSALRLHPETHAQHSPETATAGGPSVHPLWAARPATLSSISESALGNYSQLSMERQASPVHSHAHEHGAAASVGFSQPYTYPLPLHLSTAGPGTRSSVAAVAGASDGDEMNGTVGIWRKHWGGGA